MPKYDLLITREEFNINGKLLKNTEEEVSRREW